MAGESAKPNFFTLLGLNPDERWDEAKFQQVLRQKQTEWSRQSMGAGPKAMAAKKNLELIPEIRRIMGEEEERKKQAVAARAELASGRKERVEKFEAQLKIAEAKGYIEEAEFRAFVNEFKDVLSEQEIRSYIKVPIQAPGAQTAREAPQLDPSIAKDIADKLKTLNMSTLYELLGMPPTTSNQELSKAAEQLYLEMVRRQPKIVEVTVKQDLAGRAKDIFKSDDMRRKYVESLRHAPLNTLLKDFEESVNRTTKKDIHEKQVLTFLEVARKAGWSNEQALTKLEDYARQHKWFLRVPTVDLTPQQRCGFCGEMNGKERNYCYKCNRELAVACPNCGQSVPSDEIGCGKCGFPVGNRYWVDDLLNKCRYCLDHHDLKGAQEQLSEAEGAWNPSKADDRVRKIHEYRAEIQRIVQAQQQAVTQLNQLIDQRKFYAARQFLASQAGAISDQTSYQRRIDDAISQAQQLLNRARSPSLNREDRADLCRQALRVCADYKEARDLLSTMPPTPPTNLQARVGGALISLTWELSSTRDVSYKVVRKSHSKPVSAQDGKLLATVPGRIYEDAGPETGVPLYYAVFAEIEGIVSTQGATLDLPVLLTEDVTNVVVQVDDSLIDLSWKVPPNAASVLVIRKEQTAPISVSDGIRLQLLDPTHLVDRQVQNDHVYFYRVYCQFKDAQGRLVASPGLPIQAKPETPPAPITSLEITSTKLSQVYEVQLRWQPPTKGQAVILKSDRQPPFKVGKVLPKSELSKYGQLLEDRPASLTVRGVQPGIAFYTPVVLLGEMAYIGACQRHVCMEDISELKYQNLGTALRLQWQWPANCQEALVSYSYSGWPRPGEETENTRKVTRAEYEYLGHYDIRGTTMNQNYYIVVAAVVGQGGDQVVSSGTRVEALLADKIVLTYEIKNPTMFRKKRTLHLFARNSGTLPRMLLISRRDRLPMNKAEGETLYRGGPVVVEKGKEVVIELPDRAFPPRTFGKLYLEDDNAYNIVRIDHPSEDKLRLS